MEKNVIHTLPEDGERVTSTYAEIYLDDEYYNCKNQKPKVEKVIAKQDADKNEWVSPSDLLIGILELKPPFTSRITRGLTHEGILNIGNGVLEKERAKFLRYLKKLQQDNDSAWMYIQEQEKSIVVEKVKVIYEKIFKTKSQIMQKEIVKFYESSLQDLEDHIKSEVHTVLISAHANMVSDLNTEIKEKLLKERKILEEMLRKRYKGEVFKLKKYYKLLLNNEVYRNNRLINQALRERNDALQAFCKHIQAEKFTTSIYIMCTERKKCRIKQFLLENFHSLEMREKFQKIKDKQETIDSLKEKERHIIDINKEWEEKTKKVLQLFLKFISFSMKLLPEQTTFLLDLEKLVVLQLNEIIKNPIIATSILVDKDEIESGFKLEGPSQIESFCEKEPFVIEGDLADSIPTPYGSKETLPSRVDLPFIRVQRQFIYAKCQRIDEVRAYLNSRICKCRINPNDISPSLTSVPSASTTIDPPIPTPSPSQPDTGSSNELLLIEDIKRLHECPVRGCKDWAKRLSFPNLSSYLDFTEENYARVNAILSKLPKEDPAPELIKAKDIAYSALPFVATKERYRNTATQYSSQEDLQVPEIECTCNDDFSGKTTSVRESTTDIDLNTILAKRRMSLRNLLQENPNLLKMFTDESFDIQL